jgi:hypothetical protein
MAQKSLDEWVVDRGAAIKYAYLQTFIFKCSSPSSRVRAAREIEGGEHQPSCSEGHWQEHEIITCVTMAVTGQSQGVTRSSTFAKSSQQLEAQRIYRSTLQGTHSSHPATTTAGQDASLMYAAALPCCR